MNNKIAIKSVDPTRSEVVTLIRQLDAYQESMYPPESNHLDSVDELSKTNVIFLAAYINSEICGIGSVKIFDIYGEIKRVYVPKKFRGIGIAKAIVKELEGHLIKNSVDMARLETGIYQHEAIDLYKKLGYSEIAPFGDYTEDPLSVFMERDL
ncbi:MAG: GNAT family N-acetyltransferase [Desulfobacterales bacterium]|nr:GNAT family N-acetyltransferase [Desulfobacterales bacterium]